MESGGFGLAADRAGPAEDSSALGQPRSLLMPRSVVASHGDRLAIRPLSPPQALPVSLLWRAGERPTPAALAFREHVLSAMRA
jgi:DNA-binding transcriptional LysR family regulator